MKAITVYVYRNPIIGDCTNDGISSKYDTLLLWCDRGYIDIDDDNPPENFVKLVRRELFGRTVYHIEPFKAPEHIGWMSGGNYAATSDGRFSDMLGGMYGAVSVHDRQETQEVYDMLSR